MIDKLIYIVTDGEFDGLVPGHNSMLSFASVAMTAKGENLGEFEATLKPLEGAHQAPDTMAFWKTAPEAYAAATHNPRSPADVMSEFVKWIQGLGRDCILAAHPVALDGAWIDFYLQRFTQYFLYEGPWRPNRLFKGAPLCLMSFAAGKTGMTPNEEGNYTAEWLGDHPHTHRAIDDARGYASLLSYLMQRSE